MIRSEKLILTNVMRIIKMMDSVVLITFDKVPCTLYQKYIAKRSQVLITVYSSAVTLKKRHLNSGSNCPACPDEMVLAG